MHFPLQIGVAAVGFGSPMTTYYSYLIQIIFKQANLIP